MSLTSRAPNRATPRDSASNRPFSLDLEDDRDLVLRPVGGRVLEVAGDLARALGGEDSPALDLEGRPRRPLAARPGLLGVRILGAAELARELRGQRHDLLSGPLLDRDDRHDLLEHEL